MQGKVKCAFTMKNGNKVCVFHELDSTGATQTVLCPDFFKMAEITTTSGVSASIPANPQAPTDPRQPLPTAVILTDPKPPSALPTFKLPYTIFMGEISGSMQGGRIGQMRKGFVEMITQYSKSDTPYALCAWSDSADWPPSGACWLRKADEAETYVFSNSELERILMVFVLTLTFF